MRKSRALAKLLLAALLALSPCLAASSARAEMDGLIADSANPPVPQDRAALENIQRVTVTEGENAGLPFNIREDAMREAALSYGARGGLAWRTYYIRRELENRSAYMDKVFDFTQLLIPAPSGLLIEPPVISESVNAMIIGDKGTEAAVADRVYDISVDARIVGTARSWRNYVERDWGDVAPPPDILRPKDDTERAKWVAWIREGWQKGVDQADDIFRDDLNVLTADYQGMVRYRMLLSQGMVTPPYALQVDRGITGGGKNMRIGDRAVQITGMPSLVSGADSWQPANR